MVDTVHAGPGGSNGSSTDTGTSSAGSAAITPNDDLAVDASGAYTPIPPATIKPGKNDTGGGPTSAPPPYPAPGCPGAYGYVPHSPLPKTYTIYPSFTRNAQGAYDGHDAWYGYDVANAIPPGGNNTLTDDGYPASAANMAGHIIAVDVAVGPTTAWPASNVWWSQGTQGTLGPDITYTCDNGTITYGFGPTYLDGPAPA
ncbi:MAG: hypothetical protein JOZ75_12895, partial [Candidatus Dormibacteraeota bacterium]|nr:hypothetical protein [Candidatus Dormibacteraeota bacterium]